MLLEAVDKHLVGKVQIGTWLACQHQKANVYVGNLRPVQTIFAGQNFRYDTFAFVEIFELYCVANKHVTILVAEFFWRKAGVFFAIGHHGEHPANGFDNDA